MKPVRAANRYALQSFVCAFYFCSYEEHENAFRSDNTVNAVITLTMKQPFLNSVLRKKEEAT